MRHVKKQLRTEESRRSEAEREKRCLQTMCDALIEENVRLQAATHHHHHAHAHVRRHHRRRATRHATTSVATTSTIATPNSRCAWTPVPGAPNTSFQRHDICMHGAPYKPTWKKKRTRRNRLDKQAACGGDRGDRGDRVDGHSRVLASAGETPRCLSGFSTHERFVSHAIIGPRKASRTMDLALDRRGLSY